MNHPSAEAQKDLYESLAAVHLSVTSPDGPGVYARGEELVELARTLAKGGPYASTVERFARDHGYGRRDPEPGPEDPEVRAEAIRDWEETNRYPY